MCFGVLFFNINFIYLSIIIIIFFLAVLGLRFCARAFSSFCEREPLFIAVHGPLTVAASLAAEHRLQMRRLSSCGSRAQLLRGTWDLPRPGLEPVSPALAGRFSTTAPPGKPCFGVLAVSSVPSFGTYLLSMQLWQSFLASPGFTFLTFKTRIKLPFIAG